MNYEAKRIMFNSACAAIQDGLCMRAERIVNDNYPGCQPGVLYSMFLGVMEENLGDIPDSEFKSQGAIENYLFRMLETGNWTLFIDEYEWPSLSSNEPRSARILGPGDLGGSGFALRAINDEVVEIDDKGNDNVSHQFRGPHVVPIGSDRLVHRGTSSVKHMTVNGIKVPVDIDHVYKGAEYC